MAESTLALRVTKLFDGEHLTDASRYVIVRAGRIAAISDAAPDDATVLDLTAYTTLPGLIDAHFHPVSSTFNIAQIDAMHASHRTLDARQHLEGALQRGFTTVRDAGGADPGLVKATEAGLITGPRLFIAGKALSQTGGHGDMRAAGSVALCSCGYTGSLSQVVDGADHMRAVVREHFRQGVDHIKLFVSGGVLSPSDPIWMDQFTDAEIRAAVEEAATRRSYVMAHAHTANAAVRCVRNGVRSIEHGTLMDRASADEVAAAGAFVVPTLVVIDGLRSGDVGLPPTALRKLEEVADGAATALQTCATAGVRLGFGTDLFGKIRDMQSKEFALRGKLQSPIDVLRSATSINADLMNQKGAIGCVKPGAHADLIAVSGNPASDANVLAEPQKNLKLVIRGGVVVLNRLSTVSP
jgi:imidazolonepropionase-like amidohydrolase